jgi:hypothetical protein
VAVVESLKVLDPKWPIREADSSRTSRHVRIVCQFRKSPAHSITLSAWATNAVGISSLEVDDQLKFSLLEKGDVSGIGAFENFIDGVGISAPSIPEVD